jgi:hypothetical protein
MKVKHVSKAPVKNTPNYTDIVVAIANTEVLKYWHKNIQLPFINTTEDRLDKGWNWPRTIYTLHGTIAKIRNQQPICYTIGKKVDDGYLPLALVFVAEKYPALFDVTKSSSFVWYLSTAPQEFAKMFLKDEDIPKLGKLCVDVGITSSFNSNNNGVIGLHASREGGDWLFEFYQKGCDITNLGKNIKLPYTRKYLGNDGRYFYADEKKAKDINRNNNVYR